MEIDKNKESLAKDARLSKQGLKRDIKSTLAEASINGVSLFLSGLAFGLGSHAASGIVSKVKSGRTNRDAFSPDNVVPMKNKQFVCGNA